MGAGGKPPAPFMFGLMWRILVQLHVFAGIESKTNKESR